MSATQETLLQEIQQLNNKIASLESQGADVSALVEKRAVLMGRLNEGSDALNESTKVLKG